MIETVIKQKAVVERREVWHKMISCSLMLPRNHFVTGTLYFPLLIVYMLDFFN